MKEKMSFSGCKLFCLMLVLVLALSITACGAKETDVQEQEVPLNEYEASHMTDEECKEYIDDFLGLLASMPDYINADMDGRKDFIVKGLEEIKSQGYIVGDITSNGNIVYFTYAYGEDGKYELPDY